MVVGAARSHEPPSIRGALDSTLKPKTLNPKPAAKIICKCFNFFGGGLWGHILLGFGRQDSSVFLDRRALGRANDKSCCAALSDYLSGFGIFGLLGVGFGFRVSGLGFRV